MTPKAELMKAIKFKCIECCGGMREQVDGCELDDCPLYKYRPRFKKRVSKIVAEIK